MRMRARIGTAIISKTLTGALVAAGVSVAMSGFPTTAAAMSFEDVPFLNDMFGGGGRGVTITDAELASLGCLVAGTAAAAATTLLGGTAAIVTGGAGTATAVAIPVIAATAAAGCAFGSAAAPGVVWLGRNGDKLFRRIGDSLPAVPAITDIPVPGLK